MTLLGLIWWYVYGPIRGWIWLWLFQVYGQWVATNRSRSWKSLLTSSPIWENASEVSRSTDRERRERERSREREREIMSQQKKYIFQVEEGKEGSDGRPSVGPVYRSIFAKDGFPDPIEGMDSCWDVFRWDFSFNRSEFVLHEPRFRFLLRFWSLICWLIMEFVLTCVFCSLWILK